MYVYVYLKDQGAGATFDHGPATLVETADDDDCHYVEWTDGTTDIYPSDKFYLVMTNSNSFGDERKES